MKSKSNKNQTKISELKSRPEQSTPTTAAAAPTPAPVTTSTNPAPSRKDTTPTKGFPYVDFHQRELNRALSTDAVLRLIRQHLPEQYGLAEVVGKWIWIEFPEAPAQEVRTQLSQLGFHWNNVRKCWQQPCGVVTQRGQDQPREKFASYFPSDHDANPHQYNGPARTAEQVAA